MKHQDFLKDIRAYIPSERIYTDPLRTLAWGTDAGFYRMTPRIVVRAKSPGEVSQLLASASQHNVPVTFRAAGTSLSGQAITDSVLIVAGKNWENYSVSDDASTVTLEPGIVGARVNEILKPYGRMFTPDPASKKSAMVGGIVANNASGMNCGTHANSDRVLRSMGIILADGTMVDTGDAESRRQFAQSHPSVIAEIESMRRDILADEELAGRIRHKYSIKNVTGLNLRPFVEYDDPFDILAHCMVGSEGTLGFMYSVTVDTAPIKPFAASVMLYFTDMARACQAVVALKKQGLVDSCEMLDKKSLSAVHDKTGEGLTALLIDTKADTKEQLDQNCQEILNLVKNYDLFDPRVQFTTDPAVYEPWWAIRSGVFPAVGGTRPMGTTVLIEDVAFHIDDLPRATVELAELLVKCGYDDACIYGHALEGNYHFVISQRFDSQEEIDRYKHLMLEIEKMVVDRYDGSLKAEHGTGRNMAPFVEKEWGAKAFGMMRRLKQALDPQNILNPGVIFNDDPECYIKQLKEMPRTNPHVDKCIECGFCEVNCVASGFTLSARQRIVACREMTRLENTGHDPERLDMLRHQFKYLGNQTCAGDGLCSTSCPMGINTGELIHDIRRQHLPYSSTGYRIGARAAKNLGAIETVMRPALILANTAREILGDATVNNLGRGLHHFGIPLWTSTLPTATPTHFNAPVKADKKVVYFPSCINQTMGVTSEKGKKIAPLVDEMIQLCNKAGYEVIFPENMKGLCCGLTWESKGMPDIANQKSAQLEEALLKASENGAYPILCDQSPCLHRMRQQMKNLRLYEPAEFIHDFLAPELEFHATDEPVAIHITCSSRHMGVGPKIVALAQKCSTNVLVPSEVGCCGFAGDKGFFFPELNEWGLRKLKPQIDVAGVKRGFSNSRTCEIGLSSNSGVPYKSIVYLVNEVTTPKKL